MSDRELSHLRHSQRKKLLQQFSQFLSGGAFPLVCAGSQRLQCVIAEIFSLLLSFSVIEECLHFTITEPQGAGEEAASFINFLQSSVMASWISHCALALEMGTFPKASLMKHSPPTCFPPRTGEQLFQDHTIS